MDIFALLRLVLGLAFFLFGMNVMSSNLEKMAGGKLEQLLKKRLEDLDGRRSCMLECRLAEVQLRLAEYDRAEKTLEELTARWPQREAPWMLCLRRAAALRDGEAIQKTLGQIEEKEVYLSARGREIVRFWQGKQQ